MKKRILAAALTLAILLMGAGCSGGGTPPVLTFDGIELTLGEGRPYDLKDAGFEFTLPGGGIAVGDLPGKSWLSEFLSARKDGASYAYLYVYNPDRDEKTVSLTTVYKVTFRMQTEDKSYWAENNVLVNGIDFSGLDSAAVKEKMTDYKLANETDAGSLRFEDGKYKYYFSFDEATGLVDEVTVELTISKNY